MSLFISNVCKYTSEHDIADYIRRKMSEIIKLEKFKSKVSGTIILLNYSYLKLRIFLSDNMWPEGICFSKFVIFKRRDILPVLTSNKANINGE